MKIIESVRMTAHNSKAVRYIDDPVTYDVPEHAKNEHIELIAEWEKNNTPIPFVEPIPTYAQRRVFGEDGVYETVQNQLDMIYWDKINGTDQWVSHISEVKNKYPKE